MIDLIKKYDGNMKEFPPLNGEIDTSFLPTELLEILKRSNGIMETMQNPMNDETIDIGWIIYPLSEIMGATSFYKKTYGIEGTVLSDDGAGNPYYIKKDGRIYQFECVGNEEQKVAESLEHSFREVT